MFAVEFRIQEREEDALETRMAVMREWLDHRRFEPSVFRITYASAAIVFRTDFSIEAEAAMFAKRFGGRVIGEMTEASAKEATD